MVTSLFRKTLHFPLCPKWVNNCKQNISTALQLHESALCRDRMLRKGLHFFIGGIIPVPYIQRDLACPYCSLKLNITEHQQL